MMMTKQQAELRRMVVCGGRLVDADRVPPTKQEVEAALRKDGWVRLKGPDDRWRADNGATTTIAHLLHVMDDECPTMRIM